MRPYIPLGTTKIAPFKNPKNKPYGVFSNATLAFEYPVKESVKVHQETLSFTWPSAEQAFHAQKLINFKKKLAATDPRQPILTKALRQLETSKSHPKEQFLAQSDYVELIKNIIVNHPSLYFGENSQEFDKLCDAICPNENETEFGLMPNGEPCILEFMRHILFLKFDQNQEVKQLAMDCARESIIPVEVSHIDNYWGSGPLGLGQNQLGLTILELGNHYLKKQDNHNE